jgi:hypothetical protein
MRYMQAFILFIVTILIGSCSAQEGTETPPENQVSTKKLLDYSAFNVPSPKILLDNIPAMKSRGYGGSIFKLEGVTADVFVNDPEHRYDEAAFTSNYPTLKEIKGSGYKENFLLVYSQMSEGWSWLSDMDWNYAEAKLSGFAKAAKEGGLRGLMFDPEPYGFSPWRYDQDYYQGKTLGEVSQVVRERGKRFMEIIQTELSDAKILSLLLMHPIVQGWENYTLFKPFFEGMLEAALPTVQFIDGNEMSYYFLNAEDFDNGILEIRELYSAIDPSLSDKYQAQVKVANAVFVDGLLNLWRSPRFIGYYFANDAERLSFIQHNTYHALRTADEYVWIYNENINYYNNQIPEGLVDNLKAGLDKLNSGQPLDISVTEIVSAARLEFDRKIEVYGTVTTKVSNAGATISSGYTNEAGQETACNVHNAYGNFTCTFPYGTTVTLRPVLEDVEFTPREITLTNLTEYLGEQNFTEE